MGDDAGLHDTHSQADIPFCEPIVLAAGKDLLASVEEPIKGKGMRPV